MAHPYRPTPPAPPVRSRDERLRVATFVFGLVCALVAQALSGAAGAVFVTVVGTVLLIVRRETRGHGE